MGMFFYPRVDLRSTNSPVFVTLRLAPLLEVFAKRRAKHPALHVHVLFAPVRRSSETNLRVLRYFHTTQVLYPHVCQQTSLWWCVCSVYVCIISMCSQHVYWVMASKRQLALLRWSCCWMHRWHLSFEYLWHVALNGRSDTASDTAVITTPQDVTLVHQYDSTSLVTLHATCVLSLCCCLSNILHAFYYYAAVQAT